MSEVRVARLLAKSLTLYVLSNLVLVYINPALGFFSIYNWLVPGRARVPYEREVEYYAEAHTIPIFEDMNAMYRSHILARPKPADEYRVMLIGDSSTWGFELHPEDTQAGQLTALGLTACDGRKVVAYNAAFPLPYVMKDLLIMDQLREYDPDMYIWLVTLDAFRNRTVFMDYFLEPYAEKVLDLRNRYDLTNLDIEGLSAPAFWSKTIVGQRSRLKKIAILQVQGLAWAATHLDYYYQASSGPRDDQADSQLFETFQPGELRLESMLFDVLGAGYADAGDTPLLVVNEPIFVASGRNSDIRYNEFYPRWAYDDYLNYLRSWMTRNHHEYLDAWDALPAAEFTDSPFHRTPAGEKILAGLVAPKLSILSCGSTRTQP